MNEGKTLTTSPNSKKQGDFEDRIGYKTGFAQLAEELRAKTGAKKKDLKRGSDSTYYSKLLNGHIIPGWGNYLGANLGRLELKTFIRILIDNATPNSLGITVEDTDRLLVAAEYSPLDPIRNADDADLIRKINLWQKTNNARKTETLILPDDSRVFELNTSLKVALSKEVDELFRSQVQSLYPDLIQGKKERVECILAPSGSEESDWYKRARTIETQEKGSALSYTHYISGFAIPTTVRARYADARGWDTERTQRHLRGRNSRFQEWIKQIQLYPCRIIYEQHKLSQELHKGQYREMVLMNKSELEAQVENLCRYLDQYPKLEIGITNKELNFQFQVRAERFVLVQGMREPPFNRYLRVLSWILEGDRFVNIFKQLFEDIWNESLTDKVEVKAWLRGQLSAN
jgi:hypothetical protein